MSLDRILRNDNPTSITIPSDSKNIITYPYDMKTTTVNGVTFTVGTDGGITVSGTATALATFYIKSNFITLTPNKQYVLSGFTSGTGTGCSLNLHSSGDLQNVALTQQYQTKAFTASYEKYYFYLAVGADATANATFYPQLEEGITATDYSLNTGDREVKKVSYGSKNLLPHSTAATTTTTGITFTNNSNGTITVNGTATANSTLNLGTFTIPKDKTLTLSGCPDNGSTTSYYLYAYDTTNNKTYTDIGNGVTFDHSNSSINIYIRVQNETTVNNLLFKPQLEFGSKKTDWVDYNREVVWRVID